MLKVFQSIPALLRFRVNFDTSSIEPLSNDFPMVAGNVLDFVLIQDQIVYSMDIIHEPFSTTMTASDEVQKERPSVGVLKIATCQSLCEDSGGQDLPLIAAMEQRLQVQPDFYQTSATKGKSLRDLLYGLESLRKHGGEE